LKETVDRLKPFFTDKIAIRKSAENSRKNPMGEAGLCL